MAESTCFDLWEQYTDQRGGLKWVNAGHAPEGACPACVPVSDGPQDGDWNGYSAGCADGHLVKFVYNASTGGLRQGGILVPNAGFCTGSKFTGQGSIGDYFP